MTTARRLRAAPERPRVLGLVRVSKEGGRGERLLSPELQETAIREHAERLAGDVVGIVPAIDDSGSRAKSAWWAKLDAAVERVEAGEIDVIVVWKYSRLARNRRRWAVAVDRIEAAGGRIESATEPNEQTASGRFARGMLAELAAFEAERIGEGWREVHASRVRRGLPPGGKLPWGWQWEDGAVVPNPETAPFIVEAYRRYIAGAGIRDLTRWLTASGVQPMHAAAWNYQSIVQCLDSPVHAGMIVHRGELHPGAHEGLVDIETWEAYRRERQRRAGERQGVRRYLLSGIALCPCTPAGTPMNGFTITRRSRARGGGEGAPFIGYRCTTLGKPEGHGSWSMTRTVVEGALMDWLHTIAADVDNLIPAKAAQDDGARQEVERLRRQRHDLDLALTNLTVQLATGVVPEDAYTAARDQIAGRRAQVSAALEDAQRVLVEIPEDPSGLARTLLDRWDDLPIDSRRAALRQVLHGVVVDYERRAAHVWPVWEAAPPTALQQM